MTTSDQSAFGQARAESQSLPSKPDNATLLRLYSLYKQGSEGDVTAERPGGFDFVGAAKYDAWAALKGKSQADAQAEYVALVEKLKGD
ncbi:acyl-CoA-binding protein [Deinococcus detaillensis]|uniref:Acyl-CoA-binding protein n=1 Tax=Deinococcus detaillensis TaxID=2592048 RepID=A0A553V0F1_9DEIO|nr:acyl-CoA-binding protein [Deinococcus detaillensis]TSA85929.1 acyl-CoA-binding protein [Deinococcus detaillensis]